MQEIPVIWSLEASTYQEWTKLNVGVSYGGSLETGALKNYTNDVKSSDEITITKTTQTLRSDYLIPVQ